MRLHLPSVVLGTIAFGFLIAGAITDEKWAFIGFAVFAGVAAVLFPRQFAGDPEHEVGSYGWILPDSQPARSIVTVALGLVLIAIALVAAFR